MLHKYLSNFIYKSNELKIIIFIYKNTFKSYIDISVPSKLIYNSLTLIFIQYINY